MPRPVVNPDVDTEYFRNLLKANKLSGRQFASMANYYAGTVSRLITGKQRFHLEDVAIWSRWLGVPTEEILQHVGTDLSGTAGPDTVEVVGHIGAGRIVTRPKTIKGQRNVDAPPGVSSRTVALRYITAGTELNSLHGAILFGEAPSEINLNAIIGRWCWIKLRSGEELIRIINKSRGGKYHLLNGENDLTHSEINVLGAAVVEWMRF